MSESGDASARPRLLFLTDSLGEKTPGANALLWLAASLDASGIDCAVISFLPCEKHRREQIRASGIPVRFLQFFNSRIKFYAPGLTASVLLFRPDCVVLAAGAAHLHAGPLARAFRGIRLASFLPEEKTRGSLLVRLARKRCAATFDFPFPKNSASESEKRAFVENFVTKIFGKNA